MKQMWRVLSLAVLVLFLTTTQAPVQAQDDGEEVLAELQGALEWDDETTGKVGKALGSFQENMAAVMAKYEDAEEPDPQAMIGDMKKVKGDYQNQLKDILGKDGLNAYNEYVDAVLLDMFSDIAEIRLLDLKPVLELTDEQIAQLRTPVGQGYLDMMRTIMQYGDQKMNTRTKIKVGKSVKGIQSDIESAMKKTLTEEQMAALEAYKEAQKQEAEGEG